jgi:hypothetical protein
LGALVFLGLNRVNREPEGLIFGFGILFSVVFMSENFDRIRFRAPICYFPPIWELVLNKAVDPAQAAKTVAAEPDPHPWAVANHLKERIAIIKQLSDSKKLDAGLAKIAISHFEAHLKEIDAVQAQH